MIMVTTRDGALTAGRSAAIFLIALRELTRAVRVLLDRRQRLFEGWMGPPYYVGQGVLPALVRLDDEAPAGRLDDAPQRAAKQVHKAPDARGRPCDGDVHSVTLAPVPGALASPGAS